MISLGRDGRPVRPRLTHHKTHLWKRGGSFFYILLPKNRFYLHPSTWGKACVNTLSHTVMYKQRDVPQSYYLVSIKKTSLLSGTVGYDRSPPPPPQLWYDFSQPTTMTTPLEVLFFRFVTVNCLQGRLRHLGDKTSLKTVLLAQEGVSIVTH